MGRKPTNPVGKLFFTYNIEKNESTCNVKDCCRPVMKGQHSHNLETHIKTSHPEEWEILVKAKQDIENEKILSKKEKRRLDDTATFPSKKHGPLDKVVTITKKNLFVKMDQVSLLKACTEIVTVNGRPFTIFNDSGFQKILKPLTEAIGGSFTINAHNIKNHILSASNEIVSQIKSDVKNQLISLKIDCVKRHHRSILGVNIQYIKDGKICLSTLAMVEMHEKHTSANLKKMLLETLSKYNVKKEQLYSITCDNAANMIKLARIMNDETGQVQDCTVMPIENVNNSECDDDDLWQYENEGIPLANNDIENELFSVEDDEGNTDTGINELEDSVLNAITPGTITSCVRCAVHTLQLCIHDGLKVASITNCISRARQVVKKLRTPTYSSWLVRMNLKLAIIDNETRWNSIYNMLYRLIDLKMFCKEHDETNPDLKLTDNEWISIQSVVDALLPVKIATLALQKQDITLGDLYGIWWKCTNGLKSNGTILAKQILKSMKERQELLLKNNVYLSAIFLDPRYQCLLTEDEKNNAINHLIKTWKALLHLNEDDIGQEDNIVHNSSLDTNNENHSRTEEDDDLELFLSSQSSYSSLNSETSSPNDISIALHNFNRVDRLHYKTNILSYWEEQKYDKPDLYKLACVVHAVPATQVSVERSFSGLKFILSDLRSSLSSEALDAIMIIRSNTLFKNK
ncbi:hypothetical protein ACI65C_013434 [Semiaphis heraclei]